MLNNCKQALWVCNFESYGENIDTLIKKRPRSPRSQIAILDFDGVMVDSLPEVTATCYAALTSELICDFNKLPESFSKHFVANRFHVQPAADMVVLGKWCLAQKNQSQTTTVLTRQEYLALFKESDQSPALRQSNFFQARKKLAEKNSLAWLELVKPFQPLWNNLQKLDPNSFLILTNKDKSSVLEICQHYQLNLSPELVYTGDNCTTKQQNLQKIKDLNLADSYFFIDDSIHNLLEIGHDTQGWLKLGLGLASWGYVGPDDLEQANKANIPSYTQDKLIKTLQT